MQSSVANVLKLYIAYTFKTKCLQQEMKIHKSTLQRQCSGAIDLIEVAQAYQQHYEDLRTELKTEEVETTENLKTKESATYIYDSNETEFINRNYLLSLQKVDIESVLFNVFDNINIGESPIEENADTCNESSIVENSLPPDVYIQNFECYTCGYKTIGKPALISHIKNKHGKHQKKIVSKNAHGNKKNLLRRSASQAFYKQSKDKTNSNQNTSLKSSTRASMLEKPFLCSVCEYRCNHKGNLKVHIQTHSKEMLFLCSVCEYRCNYKGNLKRHMQTHTQEKTIKCSVCEYRCYRKDHLKCHMQIHSQEKPFKCSICKYQWKRKESLERHMRIHTKKNSYKKEPVSVQL